MGLITTQKRFLAVFFSGVMTRSFVLHRQVIVSVTNQVNAVKSYVFDSFYAVKSGFVKYSQSTMKHVNISPSDYFHKSHRISYCVFNTYML